MANDPSVRVALVGCITRQFSDRKAAREAHLVQLREMSNWNAASARYGADSELDEAPDSLACDPAEAKAERVAADAMHCTLATLRNAMRASRCCTGTSSISPTETGLSFAYEQWKQQELPKVLRFLDGTHHDEGIDGDRGAPAVPDWNLNQELVADLEELVFDTTAPVRGRVRVRSATLQ